MTRKKWERTNNWLWRPMGQLEIPPAGDAVIREPKEGWSHAFYDSVLQEYVAVRGTYPRTARMHPSTALAVAPAEKIAPLWWPVSEIRRHYAPARIVLSDEAPQVPSSGNEGGPSDAIG
jgi:hypothetical protein